MQKVENTMTLLEARDTPFLVRLSLCVRCVIVVRAHVYD